MRLYLAFYYWLLVCTCYSFNESTGTMHSILLMLFFGSILVPVQLVNVDHPEGSVIIQGLGCAVFALMLTLFLFGQKLVYILTGRANDRSLTQSQSVITHTPGGTKKHSSNPNSAEGKAKHKRKDSAGGSSGDNKSKGIAPTSGANMRRGSGVNPTDVSIEMGATSIPRSSAADRAVPTPPALRDALVALLASNANSSQMNVVQDG